MPVRPVPPDGPDRSIHVLTCTGIMYKSELYSVVIASGVGKINKNFKVFISKAVPRQKNIECNGTKDLSQHVGRLLSSFF